MIINNFQNTEINFALEIYLSKELLSTTSRNRHKIGYHTPQPKCLKSKKLFSFQLFEIYLTNNYYSVKVKGRLFHLFYILRPRIIV